MRIRTITCHDVYNTGASLQAYALQTYLSDLGHDVKIIDYKPDYLSRHYSLTYVPNPRFKYPVLKQIYLLLKFPARLKERLGHRKKNFDSFTANYLKMTKRYNSFDELRKDPPIADIYFAGSDQIWNTIFPNGKDPAFYLRFVSKNCARASYAASFATDNVIDEWKPIVTTWLSELDHISVREVSGVRIIKDLGLSGAVHVVDPVFLLEKEKWESISKRPCFSDKYILVYDFDNNSLMKEMAMELAKSQNLKIYTLQKLDYGDKEFSQIGPLEFVGLVSSAEYVLSNSFHATAFSLIFEKQFWVFNRAERINTRMRDLTVELGIPERLITCREKVDFSKTISYNAVHLRLRQMIQKSREFIDTVLMESRIDDR